MAVDHFTKEQFEAALPRHKTTGQPLWTYAGLAQGEHCYRIKPYPTKPYAIYLRSSVRADGNSADTAQDSIRAWVVNQNDQTWGNKSQKYVTRVKGWQDRMTAMLRLLAGFIDLLGPCPYCSKEVKIFTVKKAGPTKGRQFLKCSDDECCQKNNLFLWLDNDDPADIKKRIAGLAAKAAADKTRAELDGSEIPRPWQLAPSLPQQSPKPVVRDYATLRTLVVEALEHLDSAGSLAGVEYHREKGPVADLKQYLRDTV